MNIAAFTTGLSKLATKTYNSYTLRADRDNKVIYSTVNPVLKTENFSSNAPIHKWKDEIRKFQGQSKDANLPYFMRTNPWLKELRFAPEVTIVDKDNFLIVNKTLYELCGHNAIFN